ncbi:MAG TPA: GNAT family N-acetyltransferase [Dongiaceae bacterium]|nr:GNAT family N-acetyltransferase [Dongiaceae bacterium]
MTDRGALRIDKAKGTELDLLVQLNRQLDEDEPHPHPLPLPALTARMARWVGEGEYDVLIFRSGDRLIGYAVWRMEEFGSYLRHFFICRDQRGQGWGRIAVQRLCRDVFPKDRPVNLDAVVGNRSAIAFWHAVGFRDYSIGMELKAGEAPK